MAVPSSGELELYGDIGTELGVSQSNVSLHGMSQTAGFTVPDAMSEFYGYSGASSILSTVLYTGNGGTQSITGVGFQPDLVWLKRRDAAYPFTHKLIDSVRGATKRLSSDETGDEITEINGLKSFDSDGFTLGGDAGYNINGAAHVAWCFKAGGTAVINNDGSVTSQVSANVNGGFSIVKATQPTTSSNITIGHGLNSAPELIITKVLTIAGYRWATYNAASGPGYYMALNETRAATYFARGFPVAPNSSVFTLDRTWPHPPGHDFITYCFHSVPGISKFGGYTGNGSTNGPTITTGFEPAFVMIKRTNAVAPWFLFDNKRNPTNNRNRFLLANSSGAEAVGNSTTDYVAFNADNLKITSDPPSLNGSGGTYIYMAFA